MNHESDRYLSSYPRSHQLPKNWLTNVAICMVLGFGAGYGIPVAVRAAHAHAVAQQRAQIFSQNKLWSEVDGVAPLTNDPIGNFARKLQDLLNERDPVAALRSEFFSDSTYPNLSKQLGIVVYKSTNSAGNENDSQGYLTEEVILDALEVKLGSYQDTLKTAPALRETGNLNWQWLVLGEGAAFLFLGTELLVFFYDRRRWSKEQVRLFINNHTEVVVQAFKALRLIERREDANPANIEEARQLLDRALLNEQKVIGDPQASTSINSLLGEIKQLLTAQEAVLLEQNKLS